MKNDLVIRNISRSGLIQLTCVSLEKKFQVPIKNKNTCRKKNYIHVYIRHKNPVRREYLFLLHSMIRGTRTWRYGDKLQYL